MYWSCVEHKRAENGDWIESWDWARSSAWVDIVCNYTLCRLSKAADRLPALSGLAQYYLTAHYGNVRPQDHYYAGHWRDKILETVLWYLPRVGVGSIRGSEYKAPSWSWASCDDPIDWYQLSPLAEPVAVFLDVQVTIDGQNPFGRVKDGSLDIQAPMIVLKRSLSVLIIDPDARDTTIRRYVTRRYASHNDIRERHVPNELLKFILPLDTERLEEIHKQTIRQHGTGYSQSHCTFTFDLPGNVYNENLCLMPIFRDEHFGIETPRLRGLILQESGDIPTTYKRVGIFLHFPDLLPRQSESVAVRNI